MTSRSPFPIPPGPAASPEPPPKTAGIASTRPHCQWHHLCRRCGEGRSALVRHVLPRNSKTHRDAYVSCPGDLHCYEVNGGCADLDETYNTAAQTLRGPHVTAVAAAAGERADGGQGAHTVMAQFPPLIYQQQRLPTASHANNKAARLCHDINKTRPRRTSLVRQTRH
jgi:hypothetical protein